MIGSTTAVIPVKLLALAKSRLATHLTTSQRSDLVLCLLDHVLDAVVRSDVVQRCVVVSADAAVRTRAEEMGAVAVEELKIGEGQNAALEHARLVAHRWDPAALLILSVDLPLLRPGDLDAIGQLGREEGTVVLAPDRRGIGTNALYLNPPGALPFRFGPNSFRRYTEEALARGLRLRVYRDEGTAFDLDVPADLDLIPRFKVEPK